MNQTPSCCSHLPNAVAVINNESSGYNSAAGTNHAMKIVTPMHTFTLSVAKVVVAADHFAVAVTMWTLQHGSILGDVDALAANHRFGPFVHLGCLSQCQQRLERLTVDPMLREIDP